MNFKYINYNNFVSYCLGICNNKQYIPTSQEIEYIYKFKNVIDLLNILVKNNVIEICSYIYESIIYKFIDNPKEAFKGLIYMIDKQDKVKNKECNFYYFTTSLNTMLNIKVQFTNEFIYKCNKDNIFYPCKIKVYIIDSISTVINGIKPFDEKELDHYGVYFIYDKYGVLSYIGKSLSSVIRRSFESAMERKLIDFSRIDYRYPKSKSDTSIYEAYYIAKYKPIKNNDYVCDDLLTIELPDLDVSYTIQRDQNSKYKDDYSYYKESVIDIEEFLNSDNIYIANDSNKLYLENNNIYDYNTVYNNAHNKCLKLIKGRNV